MANAKKSPAKKKPSPPKKATAAPAKVTVELRTALSLPSNPGVIRWKAGKPVAKATVAVQGTKISATTTINGIAQLPIAAPVKGRVLEINPAASQVSSGPAGPSHGAGGKKAPAAQFRPFKVTVDTDAKGFVPGSATVSLTAVAGAPPHALLLSLTKDKLSIDWKPDFLKSPNTKTVANKANDFLVIHRTGNSEITGAINRFFNPNDPDKACIHYIIDRDGQVIKLAHEDDAVNHTGPAFFAGSTSVNSTSVGIENVNGDPDKFTDEQYASLSRLVQEIRAAHTSIGRQQVIGHMEIANDKPQKGQPVDRTLADRRIDDPGPLFEWERLENANLVRHRAVSVPAPTIFGIGPGQFAELNRLSPKTLTPDITGIQQALSNIGYSVDATNGTTISGVFNNALFHAVKAFQRRYFSGGNAANQGTQFRLGRVDFETAFAIQSVEQDNGP